MGPPGNEAEPRVVVLGGTGFIGRHVVAALRERRCRVTIGTRHPRRHAGDPSGTGRAVARGGADGEVLTAEVEAPSERMLAIAQVKGQLKAQSVEKIGALVSQNPAESVAVLRSWIHEKSAA